jgi:hypothetical protein
MVFGISAVVLSLGLVPAPAAFAQDAMQLDIDFKNSLSQGPRYQEGHDFQGRHQGRHEEGRRTAAKGTTCRSNRPALISSRSVAKRRTCNVSGP